MTWYKSIFYLFAIGLLSSCSIGKSTLQKTDLDSAQVFPYDFATASIHELGPELKEISGLSYDAKADQLLAVQDEQGIIYTLDKSSGTILQRDTFHKKGDYEGIALTDKYIFVLKSSGTLYQVKRGGLGQKPTKIKSFLNKEFDVEGVEYDDVNNSLLLCNKNYTSAETENQRFIYRYDLLENKMSEEIYLTIDRTEILTYLKENFSPEYVSDKFKKIINPELDYLHLGPSAIGVHPFSRDIYVLSSQSKVLLIYSSKDMKLISVQKLDKAIMAQPEGICFDTLGNMYISSEGKKAAARLIVLPLQTSKIKTK